MLIISELSQKNEAIFSHLRLHLLRPMAKVDVQKVLQNVFQGAGGFCHPGIVDLHG